MPLVHVIFMRTSSHRDVSHQPLSVSLLSPQADEEEGDLLAVHLTSQLACVHLRFPIPELQPASCRVPWWRRNLRKDFVRLQLTSFAANTTLGGASHASKQFELTCTQLLGKSLLRSSPPFSSKTPFPLVFSSSGFYCEPDAEPLLVLRATDSQGRDVDLLDLGEGIDWPRCVLSEIRERVHVFSSKRFTRA